MSDAIAVQKHKYVDMGKTFLGFFFRGEVIHLIPHVLDVQPLQHNTDEKERNNQQSGSPSWIEKRLN